MANQDRICYVVGAMSLSLSLRPSPAPGDYVIAADRGYDSLMAYGVTPDLVVGDFDSLGYTPQHPNVTQLPAEKDDTDMVFALRRGLELGYRRFVLLGGLGGLVFVVPTSTNFNADVAGYGFLALAVLIFGQWKPVRIMWASLFFGLMKAVAAAYSGIPFLAATGIPSYVYKMIPYLATLIVLVFTSRNSQAPRASGVPYDKGQR